MSKNKGSFFLTVDENGEVAMQGMVLKRLNGLVTVELFSWITGEPVEERTFTELETAQWKFYQTAEKWRNAGDKSWELDNRKFLGLTKQELMR